MNTLDRRKRSRYSSWQFRLNSAEIRHNGLDRCAGILRRSSRWLELRKGLQLFRCRCRGHVRWVPEHLGLGPSLFGSMARLHTLLQRPKESTRNYLTMSASKHPKVPTSRCWTRALPRISSVGTARLAPWAHNLPVVGHGWHSQHTAGYQVRAHGRYHGTPTLLH